MQYMGGKFRQSKAIVQCLKSYFDDNTVYVEPFCGGMWSACRVIDELHPKSVILNDINKPLMLLWDKCIKDGVDWLPDYPTAEQHAWYKREQPEDDPLTAYIGFGFSFGGAWFSTYIKPGTSHNGNQKNSIRRKCDRLIKSRSSIALYNVSYENLSIPDGAVVYCDPPYAGRTKAHRFDTWNNDAFWQWVRDLSQRCTVFVSCYGHPSDFEVVYSWGDTVHRYTNGKRETGYTDGTCEKLVRQHTPNEKWRRKDDT